MTANTALPGEDQDIEEMAKELVQKMHDSGFSDVTMEDIKEAILEFRKARDNATPVEPDFLMVSVLHLRRPNI